MILTNDIKLHLTVCSYLRFFEYVYSCPKRLANFGQIFKAVFSLAAICLQFVWMPATSSWPIRRTGVGEEGFR